MRFDYTSASVYTYTDAPEYDDWLYNNGYKMEYPFFGNSSSLEPYGMVYSYPFGFMGEHNEPIYNAVNAHIYKYACDMTDTYQNMLRVGYKVDISDDESTLTITFSGEVYPDGIDKEPLPLEKTFVFDIENASLENLRP